MNLDYFLFASWAITDFDFVPYNTYDIILLFRWSEQPFTILLFLNTTLLLNDIKFLFQLNVWSVLHDIYI